MQEKEKSNIEQLVEQTTGYLDTQRELVKLVVAEKSASVLSALAAGLLLFAVFFSASLFVAYCLAMLIGRYTDDPLYGFAAVALLYIVIGFVMYIKREQWLRMPIMNGIIKNIFKN